MRAKMEKLTSSNCGETLLHSEVLQPLRVSRTLKESSITGMVENIPLGLVCEWR